MRKVKHFVIGILITIALTIEGFFIYTLIEGLKTQSFDDVMDNNEEITIPGIIITFVTVLIAIHMGVEYLSKNWNKKLF